MTPHLKKRLPLFIIVFPTGFKVVTEYRPYALRDAHFRIMDKNGNVGDALKGVANL